MPQSGRSSFWQWWVSGLLLLATMINYMDRQTLASLSTRIKSEFSLSNEQYGNIEFLFGVTFAIGSLFFGFVADRISIRKLYPFVLLAWSAVGFATGLANGYLSLLICRGLLGFFEAGHWPCAMIVTQSILSKDNRVMGNSILQSGASIGAILTPIVILCLIDGSDAAGAWRLPFLVIGSIGLLWAALWLKIISPQDFSKPNLNTESGAQKTTLGSTFKLFADRRVWALMMMVIAINTSWQLIRAWLPQFLQEGRGYTEAQALYFISLYYVFTDIGCISAGIAGLWLVKRGFSIHSSRVLVYLFCSILAALTTVAAFLPAGWILLGTLLCIAAGTLGLFPCYYSFTQEVTASHMGRLTGLLSFVGWLMSAPTHNIFGKVVDRTGSYDINFAILGWAPFFGLMLFLLIWPNRSSDEDNAFAP